MLNTLRREIQEFRHRIVAVTHFNEMDLNEMSDVPTLDVAPLTKVTLLLPLNATRIVMNGYAERIMFMMMGQDGGMTYVDNAPNGDREVRFCSVLCITTNDWDNREPKWQLAASAPWNIVSIEPTNLPVKPSKQDREWWDSLLGKVVNFSQNGDLKTGIVRRYLHDEINPQFELEVMRKSPKGDRLPARVVVPCQSVTEQV